MPFQMFLCEVCRKPFPHPDMAVDCEASHYDAHGVCPSCDHAESNFDKTADGRFACVKCGLIVKYAVSFNALVSSHEWSKAWSKSCYSFYTLDLNEDAWLMTTGNGKDKAEYRIQSVRG